MRRLEETPTLNVTLDTRITQLLAQLKELGEMAETSVSRVITALNHKDRMLAQAVVREDADIDRLEVEIHELCVEILENEAPKGSELRTVIAIMKIVDSLERIGDLSENVARVVIEIGDWDRFQRVKGMVELADAAQKMVDRSLQSLFMRDPFLAREVVKDDDRVDALYDRIKERIELELDRVPENANPLMSLYMVARQFERVGDIATNIAEEVVYLVEGRVIRHQ